MQNEILDEEIKDIKSSNLRKNLLVIESIAIVSMFLELNVLVFFNANFAANLFMFSAFFLLLFYLINPLIRFLKKESTGKMAILYFIQNLFLIPLILGFLFKFESWPYASEMMIVGSIGYIFLNIIPHFELRKINASWHLHTLTILINLAVSLSFIGVLIKLESWAWGSELIIIAGFFCISTLFFLLLFIFPNQKKFAPLNYYLPRFFLGLYLSVPTLWYLIQNIL